MPNTETEIRQRYSTIKFSVSAGISITVLHIGMEQTALAAGSGSEPGATLVLEIGSQKTAREYFKHVPPAPHEMENAITAVEDEVIRARAMMKNRSQLFTADASIREIALIAGVPESAEMTLSLDSVERSFERLAAVTLGRPASREGLPTSTTFAATLLILRELMQHLKFQSITLKT
ncbi:MAG: hypothetical protein HY081_07925 [Gammaproteobacteria bacterium]|nr:hypothetical protein [Gammaproteobacteria bacterium]